MDLPHCPCSAVGHLSGVLPACLEASRMWSKHAAESIYSRFCSADAFHHIPEMAEPSRNPAVTSLTETRPTHGRNRLDGEENNRYTACKTGHKGDSNDDPI